jgi:hypothetical protein
MDEVRERIRGGSSAQLTVSATVRFVPLAIWRHCNNQAISSADDTRSGEFNVWGNSFPAEHLPEPGSRIQVGGVPFDFAAPGRGGDNVRCRGQLITVPPDHYDWLHLLTAAERPAEDTVTLHFEGRDVDFEALRVSDFWAAPPRFGERRAFMTDQMHYPHHVQPRLSAVMWSQRVPVTRYQRLDAVRLPRNIAIHVFALTLQSACQEVLT